MSKNIAAHTTAFIGDHVDYVSINAEDDGKISIAVRENNTHATVHLSQEAFAVFAADVAKARG